MAFAERLSGTRSALAEPHVARQWPELIAYPLDRTPARGRDPTLLGLIEDWFFNLPT
jgi:hypothetical protein